ncbi:hypothetical protein BAUCODRAFT_63974 [Baudoinia panamericana UAMH 10762]|uniref:DNA ligase n=1 Tax=Baudoinia panamericana (strain UAMH 10762) TaxID=717646 RepID=M2N7E6_BAUPA|nr:uncharacterized protein BAUCODRAFT_63974 [Baudoinia panamericana UAMH 10762]EMD00004.1 hypothetical protein BAUCODRAFT_63974 [Baudoinia panamericana UAMH 10762]
MSTPNKRRKKNDYHSSPQPVRSLDFFFAKQKEKRNEEAEAAITTQDPNGIANGNGDVGVGVDEELTDEQLARKLQAQWDEQDRLPLADGRNDGPVANGDSHLDPEKQPPDKEEEEQAVDVAPKHEETVDNIEDKPASNAFSALGGKKSTLSLQSATAEEDNTTYNVPFDQSPLTFDPQTHLTELKKHTQSRIKIVDTLVNLLRTIIEGDPESLLPAVWLATNSIAPPYIDIELGLGGSAISKALKKVCGLDNAALKTLYNRHGDAGDVAFEAKKRQSLTLRKPKPLTIKGVYEALHKIANAKGHGSVEVKQRIVERLVQDARGAEESRYIVRTLVQHLRIGAVKTTMLIALSRAFLLSRPPDADFPIKPTAELGKLSKQNLAEAYSPGEELVKASFARRPNYNDLVPTLLSVGISDELLVRCGLAMHIPLRPMLGGITRDMGEMLTRLQGRDFSCEFKYDGQRAQVHCDAAGKVTIFSRHLEVMTEKYPDLVALVPQIRGEGVSSFIMEGEVVAVDRASGELKPFQVLANRARKDVVIQSVKVDVCLFAFDLMYLNGEELLNRSFRERRNLLRSLFVEILNHFTWVRSMDATSADGEAVSDFFKQATDIKCEGIMVKVLDNLVNPALAADMDVDGNDELPTPAKPPPTPSKPSKKKSGAKAKPTGEDASTEEKKGGRRKALLATYEPDKRLDSWLKVKKDYDTSAADTIDLIPVGGWHGQGRKNAWWSPILLACRNEETGTLEVVTKCISGFTDAFYKANKEKYSEDGEHGNVIARPSYVEYAGEPDVWFEPQEVWEMAFADVTLSPTYTAARGLVSEERGLSLRFPRFLKVREDKGIEEASTNEFLAGLYRKQMVRVEEGGGGGGGGGMGQVQEAEEEEEE